MDEDQPTHAMVADPLVGRVLDGRYKIIRRLATGGMGQVYLGEQQGLGRTVAVKVLSTPPSDSETTDFRERFFREARLCSRLTHPNTVRIYDYGQTSDDVYYIVMEYLDGQTLSAVLREAPLDPLRVIALASQVCASLSEAHALGMIHRDLKPDNLIITRHADGREFVRVVDFGIAKDILGSDAPTQAGTLFGSPGYMSPEQILEQELTPVSDIYSLGAILYRMLTGVKPFTQSNPMAIISRQVNSAPPNFEESNPSIRVVYNLEWVTLRCMEKNPLDRFGSAGELARALRACDLELRGLLPDPELRLVDGRLLLPPGAEEQMRRFDAGGNTNTGGSSSHRRPPRNPLEPESHSHSQSLSRRLRNPAFLVLGGLIPLVAGSGAVVLGMLIVWLFLVGLGNRPTQEPQDRAVAPTTAGQDAGDGERNDAPDVPVNAGAGTPDAAPTPVPDAGGAADGTAAPGGAAAPGGETGPGTPPEPKTVSGPAPAAPQPQTTRPRPRPRPDPAPVPTTAPVPAPVPPPGDTVGRTDLKDPFED